MSYEGYEQYLCPDGHYWTGDCYSAMYEDSKPSCPNCKKPATFGNSVNETNGPGIGEVVLEVVAPAKLCTCKCGQVHEAEPARYKVKLDEKGQPVIKPVEEETHV